MSKKKPVRVGVLGLGRSGWDIHVAAMRNDRRFDIVGVTDFTPERLEQARDELGCETFTTPARLLSSIKADMIVNAMPTQYHVSLTKDAFKAGFHVLLEKPIAPDTRSVQGLIRASKAAKKRLFIHHNYRFNPVVRHLREVIDSGILGDVFEFKINLISFYRRNDWQTLKKNKGGILNNHGTHHIDWIMQMMGSPIKDVFSDRKQISDSGDTEDHIRVILRAKNGCLADFNFSTSTAADMPRYLVLGTYGTLVSDGVTSTIKYFDPKKMKDLPLETHVPKRGYVFEDKITWKEKTMKVEARDKSTFYDNVWEVLRNRGALAVTPESVVEVFKVMDKARVPVKCWRPKYGK